MEYSTVTLQVPMIHEVPDKWIYTPANVADECADIAQLAQETMNVLLLDNRQGLIGRLIVTVGIANSTFMTAREVYRPAIERGATSVVVAHNHPGGLAIPSAEDVKSTNMLIQAGKVIGIPLLDHVIIGRELNTQKGYMSMRESGTCAFE